MKNDSYIVAEFLKSKERDSWKADGTAPFITISKQCGACGEEIAFRTAERLADLSHGSIPWVVIDKNIAEHVIRDHHLPQRISRFFSEEETLSIEEHIEGLLGLSVPRTTRIEDMTRTIVRLARLGHVILIGRAAHLITARFPRSLHIRIFGSLERRAQRVAAKRRCSLEEAMAEIHRIDHQSQHFVSSYFHSDLHDTSKYDLLINTDRVSVDEASGLISDLILTPHFRDIQATALRTLRHQVLDT